MNPTCISSRYIVSARFGALTPYIQPYITMVNHDGYRMPAVVGHLRLIGRLHRWLRRTGHEVSELDEPLLERFLKCQRKKRERVPAAIPSPCGDCLWYCERAT